MISFTVIDNQTGKEPDLWKIATNEDWAKHLMYCDMEGVAISEDGTLLLLDECGNFAYCPEGRFTTTIDPEELRQKGRWKEELCCNGWNEWTNLTCGNCGERYEKVAWPNKWQYCPNCGCRMDGGNGNG